MYWVSEMVNALIAKPENISLIPKTHMREKNKLLSTHRHNENVPHDFRHLALGTSLMTLFGRFRRYDIWGEYVTGDELCELKTLAILSLFSVCHAYTSWCELSLPSASATSCFWSNIIDSTFWNCKPLKIPFFYKIPWSWCFYHSDREVTNNICVQTKINNKMQYNFYLKCWYLPTSMIFKTAMYYRNCSCSTAGCGWASVHSLAYDSHNFSVFIVATHGLLYTGFWVSLKWSKHQWTWWAPMCTAAMSSPLLLQGPGNEHSLHFHWTVGVLASFYHMLFIP